MNHFHTLTVAEIRPETDEAVSIRLDVPESLREAFRFEPGQYLTFRREMDGEDVRRNYSVCSGLYDDELRVAVKRVPGGRFSCFATEHLRPGDTIEVMPPMGRFTVPLAPEAARRYVAFAAGSGITPVMSIIRTVLEAEKDSQVTLFYGNRRSTTVMFLEALEDLKNRYMGRLRLFHVLSRELQDVPLFAGRIDRERAGRLLDSLVDAAETDHFLLCGPAEMTEDVRAALLERGVPEQRIHAELFTVPGQKAAQAGPERTALGPAEVEVEVIMDGRRVSFAMPRTGINVLDAARDQGIDLPYACKGGVCATCRAKLREGKVEMAHNYALGSDEVEAGFVLTCQSEPRSDRLVVDFDTR